MPSEPLAHRSTSKDANNDNTPWSASTQLAPLMTNPRGKQMNATQPNDTPPSGKNDPVSQQTHNTSKMLNEELDKHARHGVDTDEVQSASKGVITRERGQNRHQGDRGQKIEGIADRSADNSNPKKRTEEHWHPSDEELMQEGNHGKIEERERERTPAFLEHEWRLTQDADRSSTDAKHNFVCDQDPSATEKRKSLREKSGQLRRNAAEMTNQAGQAISEKLKESMDRLENDVGIVISTAEDLGGRAKEKISNLQERTQRSVANLRDKANERGDEIVNKITEKKEMASAKMEEPAQETEAEVAVMKQREHSNASGSAVNDLSKAAREQPSGADCGVGHDTVMLQQLAISALRETNSAARDAAHLLAIDAALANQNPFKDAERIKHTLDDWSEAAKEHLDLHFRGDAEHPQKNVYVKDDHRTIPIERRSSSSNHSDERDAREMQSTYLPNTSATYLTNRRFSLGNYFSLNSENDGLADGAMLADMFQDMSEL